ncbi:uncharacterized protein PAC_04785 [Phialocephala subalpina]|uniref:Uncharacterized protein n=1 Tax=Phialocephala subalpina TaxID=576137 RepID=A0A1L7WQ52_9HELO|nr:uncharacterized protein PAC_04785 [Phialocephala subalpina]
MQPQRLPADPAKQGGSSQPPQTYTTQQGFELAIASAVATRPHLDLAAEFLVLVFSANNVPYAFMGGYSLALRGSPRGTHDVDLTVGCAMDQLVQVVKAQSRIWRPLGPTSGVLRLFIGVGGENSGVPELKVMVDVILRGSLGAPDNPQAATEVINSTTSLGPRAWPALDLPTVMNSKLGAFFARGGGNPRSNDYQDILFLINRYMEPIYNIRSQLNATHRQEFVNAYARANAGPQRMGQVKKIKHVLGIV